MTRMLENNGEELRSEGSGGLFLCPSGNASFKNISS